MMGLPLAFAAPLALLGLLSLPVIWLLIRVTPPRPKRLPFPPLKIILDSER
ncbi:MAG: BatA domain-containing protein, partial [Rhodoblastus sp.]|nr:BatA domain-containing protein [Rhodoblastus sp.]